uniref:Uncharacterized protein n=1 Tax=Strongyloides papillosus TaxID=174720 RepID=A0A0N5BC75_STREA
MPSTYISCNIEQCDLGLVFFDKYKNIEILNNVNKIHDVEHAVLMIIKSIDNKMLLDTKSHHKVNIRLSICPYINWVHKNRLLKFIPEDHIKDNEFFEEENEYAHIVVPLYKINYNSEEFTCGKLKQPTLPDLIVGFKLK